MGSARSVDIGYENNNDKYNVKLSSLLFLIILLLNAVASEEIASLMYASVIIACLLLSRFKVSRLLISYVSPFLFLLLLGSIEAFKYPLDDIAKDIWYLAKALFAISSGYMLMRYIRTPQNLYRLIVTAAVILSVLHLIKVTSVTYTGISIMDIRNEVGGGYFITTIVLGLLVGLRRSQKMIGISTPYYYLSIVLFTASLVLSGSRTEIISFAVMILALRGLGGFNFRTLKIMAVIVSVAAVLMLSGLFGNFQDESSLAGKFLHSFKEVTIRDYGDMTDINQNWRGFESYQAYRSYIDGNLMEKLIGHGLGAKVDLGFYMPLAGTEYRYIPVLHNGYMYVLVKYGLIGLLVYLYFILKIIRTTVKSALPFDPFQVRQVIASFGLVLLFTTFVVSGVFNKSAFDSMLIILGALIWLLRIQKNQVYNYVHS